MQTAHTAGPWKAEEGVEGQGLRWVTASNGEQIAHLCGDDVYAAANAALIAAAPDLLEALKRVLSATQDGASQEDLQVWMEDVQADARAAIAKASVAK